MLDAPAAGHAITFLQAARVLLDTVRVGPINAQARDVLEMLTDHDRCRVVLVTLPEETPVNELVDTAFNLEDRVGVGLGPVVVNGLYDERPGPRDRPGRRRRGRRRHPARRRGDGAGGGGRVPARSDGRCRWSRSAGWPTSCPLAQIRLPFVFTAEIGPAELDLLADRLLAEVDALPEVV